ncbi:ExbD/TolR family protein [Piscinibacter koreensis]|uniref:Biopolymer transporter ExbD n=1 Tax=Piscinibacter koreensis TaxID=2742824 RepID=A0A7Y6NKL5_9BURK|nr:biopolymer transporter ExbD [Schlegelella koreensis]NUZ04945.1 biopolymer transporter ExbD [Schlegelella koreensis]
MAMQLGPGAGDDDDLTATINTTPLVDVMLVLLIIFLITIPVVTQTVPVNLPDERNVPRQTRPENVEISVTRDGEFFWNGAPIDAEALERRLQEVAGRSPQPEVHVRGDERARYEYVGRVLHACTRAAIRRVSFVTEPGAG